MEFSTGDLFYQQFIAYFRIDDIQSETGNESQQQPFDIIVIGRTYIVLNEQSENIGYGVWGRVGGYRPYDWFHNCQ